MDFEFSNEQEMLRASLRAFLADRCPIAYVRSDARPPVDRELWAALAELGLIGVLVPEVHGGAGGGMVDAAVALEELGRAACPAPYASSAIGAAVLADETLLPGLADGSCLATPAVHEPGRRYEWRAPRTSAVRDGDAWRLDGVKVHVAAAEGADVLLVSARDDDGALGIFAVDDGAIVRTVETVDPTWNEARVELAGTRARRVGDGDRTDVLARALERLAVALVVDAVGAGQRTLDLAVDYARERVQFDRPIGSFQAVQHLCADMLRAVELARAAAYYACWAADDAPGSEARRAALIARAYGAEALPQVGATAIQVFGGIGFTWEHDVHFFYKRLLTQSVAFGTAEDHLAQLAEVAIG